MVGLCKLAKQLLIGLKFDFLLIKFLKVQLAEDNLIILVFHFMNIAQININIIKEFKINIFLMSLEFIILIKLSKYIIKNDTCYKDFTIGNKLFFN